MSTFRTNKAESARELENTKISGPSISHFSDNRNSTKAQHEIQQMMQNSSQATAQRAMQNYHSSTLQGKTIQRQVQGWQQKTLGAGQAIYHNTSVVSAQSIIENHIQQVANAFGGGQLGSGFYTYTARDSAELFGGTVTLEFSLTSDATGQEVPNNATWDAFSAHAADALSGNDFLWTDEDVNQYKFHSGDKLTLVAVHDLSANETFSVQEYRDILGI